MDYGMAKAYVSDAEGGFVEGGNSVGRSVERLEKSVAVLADRLNAMNARLEPVTRPITPHPVNTRDGGDTPSDVTSPLVGTLSHIGQRVDSLTQQVQSQLDRLEL